MQSHILTCRGARLRNLSILPDKDMLNSWTLLAF